MTVYINDTPIKIFAGARLQDALRRYLILNGESIRDLDERIVARDRFGNIVALSSPMRHNRKITITITDNTQNV